MGAYAPFFGTTLGAAAVLLMKNKINKTIHLILNGFAAGVMVAASIWSLLIPSIEQSNSFIPAVVGFIIGIVFLLVINRRKSDLLVFSVTLHNIPEGMAVGAIFAAYLANSLSIMQAFIVSLGITIQNIPEGAIISMPLKIKGINKMKSFIYGMLSGLVEPIGALIMMLTLGYMLPLLPYLLSFAAGAMMYVVIKELLPEVSTDKGIVFFTLGFCLMMALDVALG
ncbi:Metal transporter, ZIP family [Lachnospiraceae bacterium TWA4]|nr:Metal transporter, ZIP family [Lachnospiraceae bacterium TWA4]